MFITQWIEMETRKRIYGRQYELAHIYAPKAEGEYILSKRKELKQGKAYEVWQNLREDDRMARNYDETLRYQYLRDIFFALSTKTPISVVRTAGTVMHIPTNELERDVCGMNHKEVECIKLSLRVHLQVHQVPMVQECMDVVEGKMTSFSTDFYLHDMKRMGRSLGEHPLLWCVGTSHTFLEVLDAEGDAKWIEEKYEPEAKSHYLREDDTWMGSALRCAIRQDDLLFFHDGSRLHKVSRDRFETIHRDHVERVREIVREMSEQLKAA